MLRIGQTIYKKLMIMWGFIFIALEAFIRANLHVIFGKRHFIKYL